MTFKLEEKKLVEAILFVAGRPVDVNSIKKVSEIEDENKIKKIVENLNKGYEKRNSFIEIINMDKEYWMRVKPDKKDELPRLQKAKSLSPELMQLLSYIAIKQPIRASEVKKVIKIKKMNQQLAKLEKNGFIKTQPYRKTLILTTTLHFASVFNLDPENLKESLMTMLKYKMVERIKKPKKEDEEKEKKESKKKRYTKKERLEIEERYKKLVARKQKEREEERKRREEEERLRLEQEKRLAEMQAQLANDPMAKLVQSQFLDKKIQNKMETTLNNKSQTKDDEKIVSNKELTTEDKEIELKKDAEQENKNSKENNFN
ncbi:MAG: SMC-Scp complex subunit ScpB [Candidatus Helarchaeota archaeon]